MVRIAPTTEEILPDGWYPATFGIIEEKETEKYGLKLMIPIEIEGPNGIVELTKWSAKSNHPKANIVKYGRPIFEGRPFDTEELEGVKCEIYVIEDTDDSGALKNDITKVRKTKDTRVGKLAPPKKSKVEEEDFSSIPF